MIDPTALRRALGDLEDLFAERRAKPRELAELAPAPLLELLLRSLLRGAVCRGPGGPPSPAEILEAALEAAAAGALALSAPARLRATLEHLAEELRSTGAWAREEALWWQPIHEPPALEKLRGLSEDALSPPAETALQTSLASSGAPGWLALPRLVDAEAVAQAHHQLELAHLDGRLGLEREGVGAGGEISAHRSDWVSYADGLESELLNAAPMAAALVQTCLEKLGRHLERALPGASIHPPQRAMLARYPAPSHGYSAHMDNPGGERDNGRTLTVVLYLNGPDRECRGGEIALWEPGVATSERPAWVQPPRSGSAVIFDARRVAHRVGPVEAGPARWALTMWFNDKPQRPPLPPSPPAPTATDALLGVGEPPLPRDTLLFHELGDGPSLEIVPRKMPPGRPRAGVVATVYRAELEAWCTHHLELGFEHLVLIFDHLEEPEERARAERLQALHPSERLTIWSGDEIAAERWDRLPPLENLSELRRWAKGGGAAWAVAARQALHASAALEAARTEEFGGAPLDWLLHLDGDELFRLEGKARGGSSLAEHFAAAEAAGLGRVCYLDHELLAPPEPGQPARFKLNPQLAAARLGRGGWNQLVRHLEMSPTDPRPYFRAYFNGKSAVRVAEGLGAAGVHGWYLAGKTPSERSRTLAGPSLLHYHFFSKAAFRRKYLAMADAGPDDERPFEPSPTEEAAVSLIREARAAGEDRKTIGHRLDELHERLTAFSEEDVELLEKAGLLFAPELKHPLGQD